MATVFPFAESFSRYDQGTANDPGIFANLVSRYTTLDFPGGVSIVGNGRNGQGLHLNFGAALGKTLPHSGTTVLGFAYRTEAIFGNDVIYQLSNNSNVVYTLKQDSDGTLTSYADNGGGGFVIAVSDRAIKPQHWYFIEIEITLTGTTPIVCHAEVRINGGVTSSGSHNTNFNVTDMLSQDATANYHLWAGVSGPSGSGSSTFDDIYVKDTTGYYGDIAIIGIFPNGEGTTLDWTPISGSIHYLMVNSHPVDLSKYLFDLTPGDIDTWNWDDAPGFSGTIKAINIGMDARKDGEGTKSFEIVVGATGTEAHSDEFFVSDLTPEYYEMGLETDPATGLPWTLAGFNAKEFGIKLIQ